MLQSSLGLIEKDLNRLPRDHHEYHYKRLTLNKSKSVEYAEAVEERTLRLTEMLQIYAKQHPHIGYRQVSKREFSIAWIIWFAYSNI